MIPAKIDWSPIICHNCDSCVCSTLIEYRQQGNATWTKPTSPINPTQEQKYTLYIDRGIYYQVKLTFIGPRCHQKSTYISLFIPLNQCCPNGYTLASDGEYCYQIEDIVATAPGSPQTLVAAQNVDYTTCGSYIYNTGYALNGTGTSTIIPLSNSFWVNGAGGCGTAIGFDGPLNRTGVWVSSALSNQDIGFGVCLEIPVTKQYYIGIAADNYGIVKLDGNTIISQDVTALSAQYSVVASGPFKVWHIYPIELNAGPHILELIGHNISGAAGMGCEIYNATSAELIAAHSYADLGSKLIFSSKDYIGQTAQIGSGGAGYTCPAGYSLAPCADPIVCRKIITSPTVEC